jgi:hypothetical protein
MAGNTGSPLCAELNRIANYGVYPDRDDFLEEQGAANVWAGTSGLGLLGALNYIVDPNRTDNNYKGLTAVCNELAGTTGLSDVDALRTINHPAEVLLKGTTARSASYYVDAATPTNWGSLGYVYLPNIDGNRLSVPDANNLDITGDIDLRVYVAMDNWAPSAVSIWIGKYQSTGNQRSYSLGMNSSNGVQLRVSSDGTTGIFAESTVALSIPNGVARWIRATRVAATGVCQFFTSTDGTTWTQLGTNVTVTSGNIYVSTTEIQIGAQTNLAIAQAQKIYRAQILNGIDGTTVLDVNIATDYKSSNLDTFTATTGQTVTVNGVGTVANYGTAGSLLPTTVGSSLAADSNDPKFLDHTGTNYVYLPGSITNYLEVPDAAALDITGDIDLRWYGALDDWTPATQNELLAKQTLSNRSYKIAINSTGFVTFQWSADGSTVTTATSTIATGVTDGTAKWVRATLDVDNGASGNDVKFFLSDNGTSWTQLGSTVTNAGVTSIYVGTAPVRIGAIPDIGTTPLTGKVYRAQILNGIGGTTVLDVDTSVITTGAATSFTAVTGQTVTINRSTSGRKTVAVTQPTWLFGTDDYMEVNNRYMAHSTAAENYVYLSGASGNYMTVSDTPPLSVTGDIDLRAKFALDDWSAVTNQSMLGKWSGGNRSYSLLVNSDSTLTFRWSANGSTLITKTSTVALSIADGATKWVRATLDVDNGASGNDVKFFSSDDGTTWTQLGATVTTAGVTSIFDGGGNLEIGTADAGTSTLTKGKFFRAQVLNGIDGTIVLDADASVITLPSQTTFVDRSSNAYTVTINKSGVGTFVSTGNYLYLPGVTSNYASAPDAAALDITGDLDLRVKVALDDWTPSTANTLLGKWATGQLSYDLEIGIDGKVYFYWTTNGSTAITKTSSVATGITDGSTKWIRATLDVDNGASGNDVIFYTSDDGITWTQLGTTQTTAGVTSIYSGTAILAVGSNSQGGGVSRGKFFRAQVLNGINGTVAFDANFENSITSLNQTTFTESSTNGATVTINRSGSTFRSAGVIDAGYLYPGATNTFSNSTTDFLNFGATDSFTYLVIHRQWDTAISGALIGNRTIVAGTVEPGYWLAVTSQSGGVNRVYSGVSGTAAVAATDSTSIPAGWVNGVLNTHVAIVDRSTNLISLIKNAGTATTASISTITTPVGSINPLRIGAISPTASTYAFMEFIGAAIFRNTLTIKNIADITNYFNGRD